MHGSILYSLLTDMISYDSFQISEAEEYYFDIVDGDYSEYDEVHQTPIAVLDMELKVITKYLDPTSN